MKTSQKEMSEVMKDSAIKLFGRTISLPHNRKISTNDSSSEPALCSDHSPPSSSSSPCELSFATKHEAGRIEEPSKKDLTSAQDEDLSHQTTEDSKSLTSSTIFENPKTPSPERESSKNGEQSESQDKEAPKKPDKILPCPRCNSMDTKFCYYNNYNVNQPRHFCKNCQRYWTAGGTMRNVPVGAGRRKNKSTSSVSSSSSSSAALAHYRQMMMMQVPETLQAAKGEAVLTFGSDSSPLCNSMASVLSLAEKTPPNALSHAPKQSIFVSCGREESIGGDRTSSEKRSNGGSNVESVDKNSQVFPPQFPFQGSSIPWPYPWHPAMPPPQAFCPVPFYPAPPYWAAHPISPQSSVNSPTLGKHSREEEKLCASESNGGVVLIPKTLRIDDPNEAAKSSIWSTLGIKHDEKGNSLNGFKAFSSKGDEKNHVVEASPLLHANPAAMSRSLIFHERT